MRKGVIKYWFHMMDYLKNKTIFDNDYYYKVEILILFCR
jgi:hypothetical protein